MNTTEKQERTYLEEIKKILQASLDEIHSKIRNYAKQIRDQKSYLWENKTGMDHVEKISVRQSVDQQVSTAQMVQDKSRRIQKLLQSPYFGRFDFTENNQSLKQVIYLGVHAFFDEDRGVSLIHDWRAPISTMFYDYELGEAEFKAPDGVIKGNIDLKRQYRIRRGEMDFMIESDLNIHDDVLQKELSLASDDKMKNIVATIQRDQNAIIRNEDSKVLIIQGVAGSGKTSIALHRIAFLLYRFKDSVKSKDVLIISPNKVFADFISNVLPELGEAKIPEIGIEELARELLGHEIKFQTFFDQVSYLLENNDKGYQERIKAKASLDYLEKLKEYIKHIQTNYFVATDIQVRGKLVPSWFMQERFADYPKMPIVNRLEKLVKDVETNVGIYYHIDISAKERSSIKQEIKKMFKINSLKNLYKDFYSWYENPLLCKLISSTKYEYSDVFPLIYLKMHWDGVKSFEDTKHLPVDEMQDYTPVQYEILKRLFDCKKTILGDANQSVNPFSSSSSNEIKSVFNDADCVKLLKSYRSTFEITQFAQSISPNTELEAIERHGEEPLIHACKTSQEEIQYIEQLIKEFDDSELHSLGIIAKTQKQAEDLHQHFIGKRPKVYLISHESQSFIQGITLCTAHMSKGLEFDHVIIPDVTSLNYRSEVDRSMLYVACTRAMHKLTLTHTNIPSPLLP